MRPRPSAASGNLQQQSWIGSVWWRFHFSPLSAPLPFSCPRQTSLRLSRKTSHNRNSFVFSFFFLLFLKIYKYIKNSTWLSEKCLPPKSIPSSSHLSEINVKCYKKTKQKNLTKLCIFEMWLFEQTNRPLDKLFGWYFMSLYNISGLSTWGLVYVEMCSQCAKTVSHNS